MKKKHYTIKHFGLNLPVDDIDNKNVSKLLRHLASNLEEHGDIEVYDIVFHPEGISDDDIPGFTVYYDIKGQNE